MDVHDVAPSLAFAPTRAPLSGPGRTAGRGRLVRLPLAVLALWLLGGAVAGSPAVAQDARVQGLIDRVDRLQRELVTLQRQVYRGEAPPAAAVQGDLAGDTTLAARVERRLSQMEEQLRSLTGQVEQMTYRQNQLQSQVQQFATAPAPGAPSARNAPALSGNTAPSANPQQAGATAPGAPPRVLGTVNPGDVAAIRERQQSGAAVDATAQGGQMAAVAPSTAGGGPEAQYDYAFGLLTQADYPAAEQALRDFIEQHPEHALAGNAKYWLGETYYVRGDYQQAAVTFAEAYQKYPENSKAADNLLKLGMALGALGSTQDACGTFSELLKRYPDAAVTIRQRTQQEQQRLGC